MLAPGLYGFDDVFGDPQPLLAHVRMHEPHDDGGMWVDGKWRRKRALKEQLEAFEVSIKETQNTLSRYLLTNAKCANSNTRPLKPLCATPKWGAQAAVVAPP